MSRRDRLMPRPAGWHFDQKDPILHPDTGKPSCRWCKGRVDPPKRSFCSPSCVFEWTRRTRWRVTRQTLYKMRKQHCEQCGLDLRWIDEKACLQQWTYADKIAQGVTEKTWRRWEPPVILDAAGLPYATEFWLTQAQAAMRWAMENHCIGRDPWDVDHIIPVALGGNWFDWSNLMILCKPCHVKKTRSDGSRMASIRKPC